MAASKNCSQCEKTSTAVWRIDRESSETVCNPCYLKKYPRPKRSTEENGESAKKRRKKSEDAKEVKIEPEPKAKEKKGKKGKEKKEEEVKQEIIKKEEEEEEKVKTEIKEEIKTEIKEEEVKTEIKEEESAMAGDLGLDAIFATATSKKKERHLSSRDSVMNQVNGEPPEQSDITSETEYEEVKYDEKSAGQGVVIVESSGSSKLDGKYDRMPKSSRGRQCYFQRKSDKYMYLYWHKGWKIGSEYGGRKSNAKVKDVQGLDDCLEPYPHSWQVWIKEQDKYVTVVGMRVFDAESLPMQLSLPEPLMEANAGVSASTVNETPEEAEQRKKEKEEKKAAKLAKKEEAAKAQAAEAEVVKKEGGEEAVQQMQVAPPSDSSSSSSKSQSSAEESSDEDEAPAAKRVCPKCGHENDPAAKFCSGCGNNLQAPAPMDEAEKKAKEAAAKQATMEKKAAEFEEKLISELRKIPEPQARNRKLDQIKGMLETRKAGLKQAAGMDEERVQKLVAMLERDFGTEPKKKPKQPGAPPPGHLLKKGATSGDDGRLDTAMPTTPPETAMGTSGVEPAHRHLGQPAKSALKRKGAPRNATRRMSTRSGDPDRMEVPVASFRSEMELWYQMPGSTVECDQCFRVVAQSGGSLQGALGQSQFAQFEFLCMDCSAGH